MLHVAHHLPRPFTLLNTRLLCYQTRLSGEALLCIFYRFEEELRVGPYESSVKANSRYAPGKIAVILETGSQSAKDAFSLATSLYGFL
jgi:hypothetical protein